MRRGLNWGDFWNEGRGNNRQRNLQSDYENPEDDSVIWRSLDLAKFISLQKERALYLTRADRFEDQFEGEVCLLKDADLKTS